MKSHWTDYLLGGLAISLLLAVAAGVAAALQPGLQWLLGPYHVVAEVALALVVYGLASAGMLRALLALKPMPFGEHEQDSPAFAYWKLLTVVYRLGSGALSWFTPFFLRPLLPALFGARMGPDVALGGTIDDPYSVSIGQRAVLGNASLVTANYISNGRLVCQRVVIGEGATVGANAIVMPGVTLGAGCTITSGAVVMPNTTVPPGETWRGNPARKWL